MALSGSFTGTTANANIVPTIYWSATQSIEGNYSLVSAELRYSRTNNETTSGEWYGSITINGTKIPSTDVDNDGWIRIEITKNSNTLAMATPTPIKVPHNTDGTKSIVISASGRVSGTSLSSTSISSTITLNPIAKQADIVSASNFTDEENPLIIYNNYAGDSVDTLEVCLSTDGVNPIIPYRAVGTNTDTYIFSLTDSERNVLRNAASNTKSLTLYYILKTVFNGETSYSTIAKTMTIINANPILNPTAYDSNNTTIELTGNRNNIIIGHSNVYYSANATPLKGATIKSYKVISGTDTLSTATGTFNAVKSNVITFEITDSRGNTAQAKLTLNSIGYVKPTINVNVNMDTAGKATYNITGVCYSGSFGAKTNAITIQLILATKNTSGEQEVITTKSINITNATDNKYSYTNYFDGLQYDEEYFLYARITDTLNSVYYPNEIPVSAQPIFDWSKNDFNFNVPVKMNNETAFSISNGEFIISPPTKNGVLIRPNGADSSSGEFKLTNNNWFVVPSNFAVIGTYENKGYSAIDAYTENGDFYINNGGYSWGFGTTYIRGNTLKLDTRTKLYINGRAYDENKVLWSGSNHMNGNDIIYLTEEISKQPAGVVLVFSLYQNGITYDSGFSSHFVPKQVVIDNTGWGHSFIMADDFFRVVAFKFLYINDDSLAGNNGNITAGTENGITYNGINYVLRYVIGV